MEEERKKSTISLVPQMYFGVSPEVSGCGTFIDDYTFAHISGRLLIKEDIRTRCQKFSHIPKFGQNLINAVCFDSKRTLILVADEGNPPTLNVYRLSDNKNMLTFIPKSCESEKFTSMFVHSDSERISALLGPPDNLIYTLNLCQKCVEAITPALPKDTIREVTQIVGHQEDTFHYAVLGIGLLRFVTWMGDIWEDVFHSFNNADGIAITCGTYTSIDTLLVGTADGKLMVISYDGIKAIYDPLTVDRFIIELKKKGVKPSTPLTPPIGNVAVDGFSRNNDVQFLQAFKRGITYVVKSEKEETVHVMLKGRFSENCQLWKTDTTYTPVPEDDTHPKHGFIKIHVGIVAEYSTLLKVNRPLYVISNLAINFSGNLIVLTFAGRFLMILDVKDDFDPPKRKPEAHMLSAGYNKCPVEHVTSCFMKNIFVTAGEKMLKFYNYKRKEVFLVYIFQDDVYSISLHPSGCFGLISFTDKTILFALQQQHFLPIVELNVDCCKCTAFSNSGNLMVIAGETRITVYSVYSFKQISEILDGEAGKITGIKLCTQNNHIWTSRSTGVFAQTNLKDGIMKYIFASNPKASFDEYDNYRKIYFTGFDGTLEELDTAERTITQKVYLRHGKLTDMIISKQWNLIILGTETGYIIVLQCPLKKDEPPLLEKKMHYAPIMKTALSKEETYLFSSAKDGSVCIWKITDANIQNCWDGVYTKSNAFPIPSNYKESFDQSPIQLLVDFEKKYYSRQEKIMMTNTNFGILNNLENLLDCLKSYELLGVLHPPTKFKRFKYRDYWHNLPKIGRDHVLEEQASYENLKKNYYDQTCDYIDVYKYYEEKCEEYKFRYLARIKECYEEINHSSKYLGGVVFHDVKGNVAEHIRKQKEFCELLKEKSKKMLKNIEIKGRNFIDLKTNPSHLKHLRKGKIAKHTAKKLMQTVLHRKILKLLKLFIAIIEARKICSERLQHISQAEGNAALLSQGGSDDFSYIQSDDPSDSVNMNYSYLIQHSPKNSVCDYNVSKVKKVKWPNEKTKKGSKLIKHMKQFSGRKSQHKSVPKKESENRNKKKATPFNEDHDEWENEDRSSCSSLVLGDTFVIKSKKEEGSLNVKRNKAHPQNQCNRGFKNQKFKRIMSKVEVQRERLLKIEDILRDWRPKEGDNVKIPLMEKKYAHLVHGLLRKPNYYQCHKNVKSPSIIKAANFRVFPKMFNYFKHTKKFVQKISPFFVLKRQIYGKKFRRLLLNYSPNSKLSKLAVKHLIISKEFQTKTSKTVLNTIRKYPSTIMKRQNLVDYDPFSDYYITGRQSVFNTFSTDDFTHLSNVANFRNTVLDENESINIQKKPICSKHSVCDISFSEIDAVNEYQKIKVARDWENLCQLAYPYENHPDGITITTPTSEYLALFKGILMRNLELPKSALPILKQLLKGHLSYFKKSAQEAYPNRAMFPIKDLWLLKSINVLKYIKLPFTNISGFNKIKLYNEKIKKDSAEELFPRGKIRRRYLRLGKLDQLPQERLNYNICHEKKWSLFEPPISKNLMYTLIGNDLLYNLEKSSDNSSPGDSSHSSLYKGPGPSQWDDKEPVVKLSDTDLWKSYFLDEELHKLKNLDKRETQDPSQIPVKVSQRQQSKRPPDEDVFITDDQNLIESSSEENYDLTGLLESPEESEVLSVKTKEAGLQKKLAPDQEEKKELCDFDLELENNVKKYVEYLKTYQMYFCDENLFPIIKLFDRKEIQEITSMKTDSALEILNVEKSPEPPKQEDVKKVDPEMEKTESLAKDGFRNKQKPTRNTKNNIKESSPIGNSIPSTVLLKKQKYNKCKNYKNVKTTRSSIEKVVDWLAESKIETALKKKKKLINSDLGESSASFDTTFRSQNLSHNSNISALKYEFNEVSDILQKDGINAQIGWENEKVRELWEQLYNITFRSTEDEPSRLTTPYNLSLWAKLFRNKHPKTTESFDKIKFSEVGELTLKLAQDKPYDKMFEDSLPKKKCPDDPSDEIETISSLEYLVIGDDYNKKSNYSIYTKQKVNIITHLKNKVWFIPDEEYIGKENNKGKFYYPGNPIWHKGIISSFLQNPSLSHQPGQKSLDIGARKYIYAPGPKKAKNKIHGDSTKMSKARLSNQNYESIAFNEASLPLGQIYILPFKYKMFWKVLEKSVGNKLAYILRTASKRKKEKINRPKGKREPLHHSKPLVVKYNQVLMDILTANVAGKSKDLQDELLRVETSGDTTKALLSKALRSISSAETTTVDSFSQESDESDEGSFVQNSKEKHNININSEIKPNTIVNLNSKNKLFNKNKLQKRPQCNYGKSPSLIKNESNTNSKHAALRSMGQENSLYKYRLGLEWGLYKNFISKVNKPHIFKSVKCFKESLYEWIKSYDKKENLHILGKKQKKNCENYDKFVNINKKQKNFSAITKISWPDCLTKVKGKSLETVKSKLVEDVHYARDILQSNRKLLQFYRHYQSKTAVDSCKKLHEFIPATCRIKMSCLPQTFKLQMLDGNYHVLRKLRESFMAKRLRKIQNYWIYKSKLRRPLHQKNICNSLYSGREHVYRRDMASILLSEILLLMANKTLVQNKLNCTVSSYTTVKLSFIRGLLKNLEKAENFHKEYCRHKAHMLLWMENIKTVKGKLSNSQKMANDKWDLLETMKDEIMNVIQMFTFGRDEKKIREVAKALVQKYAQDSPKLRNKLIEYTDYEQYVLKNLKLHNDDTYEEPVNQLPKKNAYQCLNETKHIKYETCAVRESKDTTQNSRLTSYWISEKDRDDFCRYMDSMTIKLESQGKSLKTMRHLSQTQRSGLDKKH